MVLFYNETSKISIKNIVNNSVYLGRGKYINRLKKIIN